MSEFFVRRPIVAIVIAILMTLIGGVCMLALPIAQYPQIAPPEIQVQTHYTGADALTVEQSVAAPIEQLMSVPGIGNVQIFGAGQYAMRLWVKPDQLAKLGITVPDIITAVQKQNTVNPAGQVGGEPIPSGQKFTYTVRAQGRLQTPEEFGEIVVRANADGSFVRVKDIARIDLGAQTYNLRGRLNGQPAAILAVYQLPGTNAVQAAQAVRKLMAEAKQRFPADMDFAVSLDQTLSVTEGLNDIVKTLF